MRGGYQLLNLKGSNFVANGTGATVSGAFDTVNTSYTKTFKSMVISGYSLGGTPRPDSSIRFVKSGDNFVGTIAPIYSNGVSVVAYNLIITPDDAVTIVTATVTQ
jgi:hypothetical protein